MLSSTALTENLHRLLLFENSVLPHHNMVQLSLLFHRGFFCAFCAEREKERFFFLMPRPEKSCHLFIKKKIKMSTSRISLLTASFWERNPGDKRGAACVFHVTSSSHLTIVLPSLSTLALALRLNKRRSKCLAGVP